MKTANATSFLATAAHGLTTPIVRRENVITGAPVEGYGVVDITWEVETTPGGPTVVLNGTIEEVHD
ncbi:hypothetical protein QBC38DRAFT_364594 [Podospora fimiseda]|uniref:Uncharacterized protein n=1 Tax=Podospora fimiseda TaxID=252190 RepID=A0AAN7BPR4_9PEZI|nr:hypothetical protein QBC38DRAFT_364594 [Podospora fimiseda]